MNNELIKLFNQEVYMIDIIIRKGIIAENPVTLNQDFMELDPYETKQYTVINKKDKAFDAIIEKAIELKGI